MTLRARSPRKVVLLRDGEEGDRMILTAHWEAFSEGYALHNVYLW
jgi:hypothetical protein